MFRTAGQAKIPGARWSVAAEMNEAKARFFDLIELDAGSTAELYAARGLYLDAVAGDVSFAAEDVLDFLVQELEPFWQRIEASMEGKEEGS